MRPLLPRILRQFFPERKGSFVFEPQPVTPPARPEGVNLYIHLPFCRQLCPFCPYMKTVYDPAVSAAYGKAILQELEGYRRLWGKVNVESVFFGGGTPSMTPELIEGALSWIAANFHLGPEIGVEVNPRDATPEVISTLKNCGVNLVSLGVQSFNDRLLRVLGRDYDAKLALQASQRLLQAGLATVDIDLMFAIPTQSRDEAAADAETTLALGADQVSAYPLLFFTYAPLRQQLRRAKVAIPPWWRERQMLATISRKARAAGYERTSIWSFNRPRGTRYTTVTRDSFVGIGASATSRIGDHFTLNTFSVSEYIKAVKEGSPQALATRLNTGDQMAYWLFWRAYDLAIDTEAFRSRFGRDLPQSVRAWLALFRLLGIARRQGQTFRLTEAGAYLVHLVEKEYTHAYLERLWGACLGEPWPRQVVL